MDQVDFLDIIQGKMSQWEMDSMELINNTEKTLRDDLAIELRPDSKLSIAAACFSIYAFEVLKKELEDIDELRFIFTSPTFTTEKIKREKRVLYSSSKS